MVRVTRIKGGAFFINEDHIETMESNPDTVITLVNGIGTWSQNQLRRFLHGYSFLGIVKHTGT